MRYIWHNLPGKVITGLLLTLMINSNCSSQYKPAEVAQWTGHEIQLKSEKSYKNSYTDVDVWAVFVNNTGDSIVRPAFWDGGNFWKVRFAPPDSDKTWSWRSYASATDAGLANKTGTLISVPYKGKNKLFKHGLLRMSPGKRNVIHADGTPFFVVGDTPWSIPFRANTSQVNEYAADRKIKGFNTALLLTVQPDKNARGPDSRNTPLGFDVAFEDIPDGHITKLKPDYYQVLDSIVDILIDHELVPVYAPLAHGYGWKGLGSVGSEVSAGEYARYCRYLVARYGSMPAFWLVNLDGNALAPGVKPGGMAIEEWDGYQQPTGIHYSPYDDYIAGWAKGDSSCCFHYNRNYQNEPWLDFQWAQTGHDGKHLYHKVYKMYDNQPVKASMNGESTYEGMGGGKLGLGWWQGEDAWNQLMHGATMGVIYGAACLWQWKITSDESGWPEWTDAPYSWQEALHFEGSKYIGFIKNAFAGFNYTDMERRWDLTNCNKPLLAKEGVFYMSFLSKGGNIKIKNIPAGLPYFWFNPVKGIFEKEGTTTKSGDFNCPDNNPWVLIIGKSTR